MVGQHQTDMPIFLNSAQPVAFALCPMIMDSREEKSGLDNLGWKLIIWMSCKVGEDLGGPSPGLILGEIRDHEPVMSNPLMRDVPLSRDRGTSRAEDQT